MTPNPFDEEKELRSLLESWGRQHDCVEAGCDVNPAGEKIPLGKPAKRARTGLTRAQELWHKHRKGELI